MEPWGIAVLVVMAVLGVYLLVALFIVFGANRKLFGVRGEDPSNPCYLRYEDFQDHLERTPYQTGYYAKAIRGYLYKDTRVSSRKGFIILSHGFFGTHVQYLLDIDYLCSLGYEVLAYDQYGAGLSDGSDQESLATGVYVLENVLRDVGKRNLNGNLPLFLYGHSWGAYSVAGALRNHPEIKGAIARSAPVSPYTAARDLLKRYQPKLARFLAPVMGLCCFLILGRRDSIKATRGPKKNRTTPLLLIQAEDDPMVPYKDSLAHFYERHPQANVEVFLTEKGRHNSFVTEEGQDNYKNLVKEYHELQKLPESEEKTRKMSAFTEHLDRVSRYPKNEDVATAIRDFYGKLSA
jgi:alpha-beta hydrolase superfamily lysophospholipase